MSERPDIESEIERPAKPELAKVYEWGGKALFPFSAGRHTALQRVNVIGGSELEAACALVRLCQMTPEEVSAIRGAECKRFHIELAEWMDKEGIALGTKTKAKTQAILALYDAILGDLYAAEGLDVAEQSKGGNG